MVREESLEMKKKIEKRSCRIDVQAKGVQHNRPACVRFTALKVALVRLQTVEARPFW